MNIHRVFIEETVYKLCSTCCAWQHPALAVLERLEGDHPRRQMHRARRPPDAPSATSRQGFGHPGGGIVHYDPEGVQLAGQYCAVSPLIPAMVAACRSFALRRIVVSGRALGLLRSCLGSGALPFCLPRGGTSETKGAPSRSVPRAPTRSVSINRVRVSRNSGPSVPPCREGPQRRFCAARRLRRMPAQVTRCARRSPPPRRDRARGSVHPWAGRAAGAIDTGRRGTAGVPGACPRPFG